MHEYLYCDEHFDYFYDGNYEYYENPQYFSVTSSMTLTAWYNP